MNSPFVLRYAGQIITVAPNSEINILSNGEVVITPQEERVLKTAMSLSAKNTDSKVDQKQLDFADAFGEEIDKLVPANSKGKTINPNCVSQRTKQVVLAYLQKNGKSSRESILAHLKLTLSDVKDCKLPGHANNVPGIKRNQGQWSLIQESIS